MTVITKLLKNPESEMEKQLSRILFALSLTFVILTACLFVVLSSSLIVTVR